MEVDADVKHCALSSDAVTRPSARRSEKISGMYVRRKRYQKAEDKST